MFVKEFRIQSLEMLCLSAICCSKFGNVVLVKRFGVQSLAARRMSSNLESWSSEPGHIVSVKRFGVQSLETHFFQSLERFACPANPASEHQMF